MVGTWRDPQPLRSARYGGIIDRLDVNSVLREQEIARRLASFRISNKDRHDVGVARHDRQRGELKHSFDPPSSLLVSRAFPIRSFQVPDGGCGGSADGRWQSSREYEARRVRAHRV